MFDNNEMLRGPELLPRVAARILYRLPDSDLRARLLYRYRENQFYGHLARRLGNAFTPVDPGPVAPPELIVQTAVLREADVPRSIDAFEYVSSSYMGVLSFLHALERCGFNLRTVGSILDFGCGTGINIRLLRSIEGVRLVGTDVNSQLIEWCRRNIPGVQFHLNELEPPLGFAEDDSFDLVLAASVFTHIPLRWQNPWLEEIRRVMRPAAFLVCTVAGPYHMEAQLSPEQRAILYAQGEIELTAESPGASLATKNTGLWDIFQTRARVVEAFGRVFGICDYVATGGQHMLVLQKPVAAGRLLNRSRVRHAAGERPGPKVTGSPNSDLGDSLQEVVDELATRGRER